MKPNNRVLYILLVIIVVSCAIPPEPIPTLTTTPTEITIPTLTTTPTEITIPTLTITPTSINTTEPIATITISSSSMLTSTPEPVYITLGSPFASDCGDGIPVIWAMNSFNGPDGKAVPGGAGHSDILAPINCDPSNYRGEIIMPVDGVVTKYMEDAPGGGQYNISLPPNTYLKGTTQALEFAGLESPKLGDIQSTIIRIGHVEILTGEFLEDDVIGDMVYDPDVPKNPYKVAWEIRILYHGIQYKLSPNLFETETDYFCPIVNNGCEPIPLFYGTR